MPTGWPGPAGKRPTRSAPATAGIRVPMAPPMAAAVLGLAPPTLAELAAEIDSSWPARGADVGLIEGAGGVASPLAADGDTADLGRAVAAEVALVVADAGLGTINAVRLAVGALAPIPVVVYLNRFEAGDDLHRRNRDWLTGRDRFVSLPTRPSWST